MRLDAHKLLLVAGFVAFVVAGLSIVDMFLPRPYDGVVLEADAPGRLVVRSVLPGSGAHRADIRPGDQIVGIDRELLADVGHAGSILNRHAIGDEVPYFVRGTEGYREARVELGRRQIGSLAYLAACLLGFAFFFVGLWVLRRQPRLRAAQVFFVLSTLFLLFLVCRLRPASYSWVDSFVLTTGMMALLFLPASFFHFFLIFPRPIRLRPEPGEEGYRRKRRVWLGTLIYLYLIPPLVLAVHLGLARWAGAEQKLIGGAPVENWWVLALYMLLGLGALAVNSRRLTNPRERTGALLLLIGTLFGLLPFLVTVVAFPELLYDERRFLWALAPLVLVPLTFAYAIVRFQLLDIRVLLRKSLLYTATTAAITGLYALGIALFNAVSSETGLAASRWFPLLFALAIVFLFEPLRRLIQRFADRFFLSQRTRLEEALFELGNALTAERDLERAVRQLVERLPELLGLQFAALYLVRDHRFERRAGPATLPKRLPMSSRLTAKYGLAAGAMPVARLRREAGDDPEVAETARRLLDAGVELVGNLASSRRQVGLVLLSAKTGQMDWDPAELALLNGLFQQAAIGLETSLLLEERTRQAELERELEIAASVQTRLLPETVYFGPGWRAAAACRPARHVGGDFFTELPGPTETTRALVWGDVAGKSVAGALVMMAAHEVLHSLALTDPDPERLLNLANRRLYTLGRKSFVALAYLTPSAGGGLDYLLAGQPQPLLKTASGEVRELELPANRLPLGALDNGTYRATHLATEPGDLVLGYSDGVVEARSPTGQLFGFDRLREVVAAAPAEPAALVDQLLDALTTFTRGSEPYDDVTLVAVARDREMTL